MSNLHVSKAPYPAAFRQQMVELVQSGRNRIERAREFGRHARAGKAVATNRPTRCRGLGITGLCHYNLRV